VVLFVLLLWFLNYHINLSDTTWRCTAWAFIDHSPQSQLRRCYSSLITGIYQKLKIGRFLIVKVIDLYLIPANLEYFETKGVANGSPTSTVVGVKREDKVGVTFATANLSYEDSLNRSHEYYKDIDQIVDKKRWSLMVKGRLEK